MLRRYTEFSQAEFQARHRRAQALMEEQGLDALMITDRLNYAYFTGHRSEQSPIDKIRPYVSILPRSGEGVLITMEFEKRQVLETTWIENIHIAGLRGRAEPVIEVIRKLGLDKGRIGAELGREQYLGISPNEYDGIRNGLADATFVDAAPLILKLRATKSPAEVAYIRRAGELLSVSMLETFDAVKVGMTEIDIMRTLRTRIAHNGGERVTFMWVVSSRDGMIAGPTERRMQAGDLLVLDAGVEYRGYCSDVSRSASLGTPNDDLAEFYAWMSQAVRIGVDHLRVGNTPRGVVEAVREFCRKRGLEAGMSGRIGHGVGLASTEYPSLDAAEPIVFEEGMVFACNPNFYFGDYGWLNNEDNWVVTADGPPELLSAPAGSGQLHVIRV